jgi:hypothetical protein
MTAPAGAASTAAWIVGKSRGTLIETRPAAPAEGAVQKTASGFGVARHIFEPMLRDADDGRRAELITGAATLALSLVEAGAYPGAAGSDPSFAAIHGLYRLTVNATLDRPTLLVVDDVHWADPASVRWLLYLANRLEDFPWFWYSRGDSARQALPSRGCRGSPSWPATSMPPSQQARWLLSSDRSSDHPYESAGRALHTCSGCAQRPIPPL